MKYILFYTTLFLITTSLNAQIITADNQIVVMIDDSDSIYYADSLIVGFLITNHNSVKITPLMEVYSESELMDLLVDFKSSIDTIPDIGEWCEINIYYKYGDDVIKCLQSHNRMHFLPEETPALWLFRNPITCDQWIQPTGAHDAYNIGDCVTFEGNEYISLINANVWSPTVYPAGWELQ